MKKAISIFISILLSIVSFGQAFEGKIVYLNTYKSKISNVSDDQFNAMMGSTLEYYIKKADYKSVVNGTILQWQLYSSKENKLYTKMSNSESALWNDGAINADEVLKVDINKSVTQVLGYSCDEIILTCKSGVQKYYYNTVLAVDQKLFSQHKFGNWYEFLSRSNALPLKMSVDNGQFYMESIATSIEPQIIDQAVFALPEGIKITKSPF